MCNNKKNLLIRTSSLGDVVFNIPLANRLKENGYNVTWLVGERGIDVVKNNPCVDDYIFVPVQRWQKQNIFKTIAEYIKIIRDIRARKFDIAIDNQGLLFKSGIFLLFSGAKRRITSEYAKEFSVFCGNEVIKKSFWGNEVNIVKKNLVYADYLNAKKTELKFSLPPSTEDAIKNIDRLIVSVDKTKPIIIVCPATTWVGKHGNKDNWKALISKLSSKYSLIFTGTAKDAELIKYVKGESNGLDLTGKTSCFELIELFNRANLVLSLDSGSTHLARATENPKIVSIFCCTKPEYFAPFGNSEKYITVSSKECNHCNNHKCNLKNNRYCCTNSPSVDEVYEQVVNLI